ncbi:RNA polymerase-associated protein LEO1-like [Brevipalpus obovatus]|uniref:RNA polymerase-associated protein LEO1-like n=1 Tax=Brevipalpus obovatus TaxID=246614 RepID=UPI003D9F058F
MSRNRYVSDSDQSENSSVGGGEEIRRAVVKDLDVSSDESGHESIREQPMEDEQMEEDEEQEQDQQPRRRRVVEDEDDDEEEEEVVRRKPVKSSDASSEEESENESVGERPLKRELIDDEDEDQDQGQEKEPESEQDREQDEEEEEEERDQTDIRQELVKDLDVSSEESEHESVGGDKPMKNEQMEDDEELEQEQEQERERERDDPYAEQEPEQEPVPIARIEVEIPKTSNEMGSDIHFVKLPNFLSVDTQPYDPNTYEDEIDDDDLLDEEGRTRLKLKVESTMRWRRFPDENGILLEESNARIVKWSDTSMSLHLGSEIFDIHKQSLVAGDNNHLFIRQGTGLQGQEIFRTKLTFRPHSTDSFTHRKMTLSLAERSHKTQKIRVLPTVGKDPEAHRSEMIKKEEDKLKASIRRENKAKRTRERAPYRLPTTQYLEDEYDDDDDEGGISVEKIKNEYKNRRPSAKGGRFEETYSSDDDNSDPGVTKTHETRKKTAKVVESDDDDD